MKTIDLKEALERVALHNQRYQMGQSRNRYVLLRKGDPFDTCHLLLKDHNLSHCGIWFALHHARPPDQGSKLCGRCGAYIEERLPARAEAG